MRTGAVEPAAPRESLGGRRVGYVLALTPVLVFRGAIASRALPETAAAGTTNGLRRATMAVGYEDGIAAGVPGGPAWVAATPGATVGPA